MADHGRDEPAGPAATAATSARQEGGSASPVRLGSGRLPPSLLVPAAAASLLALLFLILAVVVPEPGRHAHGLLVVVDLAGVIGVAVVWLRVIRLLSLPSIRGRVE
ncbi:hypothetical protein [Parafrankia sp. FMc2]|uniref:hypothetical protein n=1 Tax=Parafrankia sp. FMc2 TaxID=3233196 RepID=UPI0034D51B1B